MPSPSKRPAAATPSPGRSKAAKVAAVVPGTPADPVMEGCAPIVEFIGKAGCLPKPCFEMVSAMLPFSLRTPTDKCHEFQAKFIKQVTEALGSMEATRQAAVETAEAGMGGLPDEKAAASAALAVATEKSETASKERDVKDSALKDAMTCVTEAEAALAAAEESVKNLVPERTQAEERKAEYDKAYEKLEELKAAAFPGKEWRKRDKAIEMVLQTLELIGIEDSLKFALPTPLKGKPADIKKFGAAVIKYTDQLLASHISKTEQEISSFEEKGKTRDEALGAAKAALEVAKDRQGKGQDEFIAADNKLFSLDEDKEAAAATLAALEGPKTAELAAAVEAAAAQLAEVRDVMAKLEALRSITTEPAAAAEPAAATEPAVAAEAPAEQAPDA